MNTPEKKAFKEKGPISRKGITKAASKSHEVITQKQGECVDDALHGDLVSIMQENSDEITNAYPEGSFSGRSSCVLLV